MTRICVVMAVYQPNAEFLLQQLASIAAQTHTQHDLLCVIADRTSDDLVVKTAREAGLDVLLLRPDTPLDAVRAFEFGLTRALEAFPDTQFFALADQDDIWLPSRLGDGLAALKRADTDLVHSDATLIDHQGRQIGQFLFHYDKRPQRDDARSLLCGNTVTGMTALFRRSVVERALPFPPQDGVHFYHDLWLALIAAAGRGITRLSKPLVAYRQHETNTLGASRGQGPASLREAAASYALARFLAISLRQRVGETRNLRPFWKPTHAVRFIGDAARHAATGRFGPARQAIIFAAISAARPAWAVGRAASGLGPKALRGELTRLDERLYAMSPGQQPHAPESEGTEQSATQSAEPWWVHFDPRTRLRWTPAFTAPRPAINVLVPSLNPSEIFAGIATAIDLGLLLAKRGHAVRFIATDLPVAAPAASRAFVLSRASQPAVRDHVTLTCGVKGGTLPTHPGDLYVATAWWTAHLAQTLTQDPRLRARDFYYLIQDYEPLFYPWGTEHAGALASYDLGARPVFNTRLLADYTRMQGHRFAAEPLVFAPSINVAQYADLPRPDRRSRRKPRLVLYGRPEVPRNLFPLAIESLGRFVESEGLTKSEIEIVSLGLKHRNVLLPGGIEVQSRGKLPWSDYPGFLANSDVGLSLMMSPHPSHPPIEMAAAGMRVVTNRFGPKDLGTLAPHILSSDMTVPALSAALSRAWHMPEPTIAQRGISLTALGHSLDHVACAIDARLSEGSQRCAA
ncbi:glycosyltransferase [Shimia ponticola]|uniref:rhamnosyltransferase WsaF family glycosyltransferase n=1 Tax=Shimia ponticola TaxID=2582893 RepID=UPI0011BD74CA|nr:glycosyltransferase [Shimia ponticola]